MRNKNPKDDKGACSDLPRTNAVVSRRLIRNVITKDRLRVIAALRSRAVAMGTQPTKAFDIANTAIRELNEIARLAGGSLLGHPGAKARFRERLAAPASNGSAGLPSGRGGAIGSALAGVRSALGKLQPCGDRFSGAMQVLEAAFYLDILEKNPTASYTAGARAYLQERLGMVRQFEGALQQAPRAEGIPGRGMFAPGFGGVPGSRTLPGDQLGPGISPDEMGFLPPGPMPDPIEPPNPNTEWCDELGDLCMTLYQEAAAALMSDPFVELIAAVSPNCLCHDYDTNQVFVAQPATGRQFPVPLTSDIRLYFRGEDITSNIVHLAPDELRFTIPPSSHTGYVYLRGPFPWGGATGGGDLERLCGMGTPEFPFVPQQGPAALISIIYPPAISFFSANGLPGPEVETEACSAVNVCWRVHLSDQPPHLPLPPCGRIEVTIRNTEGNPIIEAGPESCMSVNSADTRSYTLEARSLANDLECGVAEPRTITVRRIAQVHLMRDAPQESELVAGADGSFFVAISCPAPNGGVNVALTSSEPELLQVPGNVVIPAGQTRAQVAFTTADQACGRVEVRATALDHQEARLAFDVFRTPVLDWATTWQMPYAPPRTAAFANFLFTVSADCIPQPESRLSWRLVRIDAGGAGTVLPITVNRPPQGSFFVISPTTDARSGLVLGTWAIVTEIADHGLVSAPLPFEVDLCEVDITLDSVEVTAGQDVFEGDLELALTANVRRDPPPIPSLFSFDPPHDSLRWPAFPTQHESMGEGEIRQPRVRIATYRVGRDEPIAADIEAIIREHDSFLQFSDDVGRGTGRLVVSCQQENTLVLDVVLIGGVFRITGAGGGQDCIGVDPGHEAVCASFDIGSAPTGAIQLIFKASPRTGP